MNLTYLLTAVFFAALPASAKKDPTDSIGACVKKCLTTTLSSSDSSPCGPSITDWACLCSDSSLPSIAENQVPLWTQEFKQCHDKCSIGQREGLYNLFAKDKGCKQLLVYLKQVVVKPKDDKQKVLKKEEEGEVLEEGQEKKGKSTEDDDGKSTTGEGEKVREDKVEEEGKKKKKEGWDQSTITMYSFLTAVAVIILSVIGGFML